MPFKKTKWHRRFARHGVKNVFTPRVLGDRCVWNTLPSTWNGMDVTSDNPLVHFLIWDQLGAPSLSAVIRGQSQMLVHKRIFLGLSLANTTSPNTQPMQTGSTVRSKGLSLITGLSAIVSFAALILASPRALEQTWLELHQSRPNGTTQLKAEFRIVIHSTGFALIRHTTTWNTHIYIYIYMYDTQMHKILLTKRL